MVGLEQPVPALVCNAGFCYICSQIVPPMKLRIALCQTAPAWESVSRNLESLEPIVAGADAHLVLLPELFATGFTLAPAAVAEGAEGPVLTAMRRWAATYGKAVAGSVAVAEAGTFRNRMYFAEPSGRVSQYDKYHLFTPGGEGGAYTPGRERATVEYMGWRLRLAVCYDLRFPVWCRNRGDYDAMLCCASWSASRREAWCALLRARAIENQCYVVGVNRTGCDPTTFYAGDSMAIDHMGRTLVHLPEGPGVAVAELDPVARQDFLRRFPVWRDADEFSLGER